MKTQIKCSTHKGHKIREYGKNIYVHPFDKAFSVEHKEDFGLLKQEMFFQSKKEAKKFINDLLKQAEQK